METTTQNSIPVADDTAVDCPFCAETIKANAKKCRHCGELLDPTMRHADEARRAGASNVYVNAAPQGFVRQQKSKVAAVLLALLLGGIGGHKFYLGQTGFGILYLVFCWTFIPGIIALVEAIIYACTSEENFHAKYG